MRRALFGRGAPASAARAPFCAHDVDLDALWPHAQLDERLQALLQEPLREAYGRVHGEDKRHFLLVCGRRACASSQALALFCTGVALALRDFEESSAEWVDAMKKKYGTRRVCGKMWKARDVAYKCKTCQADPSCAICVECFEQGNHENHDYLLIRTGGGCCDCGDMEAWASPCRMHSPNAELPKLAPEVEAHMRLHVEMLLRALVYLLIATPHDAALSGEVMRTLEEFCDIGDVLKHLVAECCLLPGPNGASLLDATVKYSLDVPAAAMEPLEKLFFSLMGSFRFKEAVYVSIVSNYAFHARCTLELQADDRMEETRTLFSSFSVQLFTVTSLSKRVVTELHAFESMLDTFALSVSDCTRPTPVTVGPTKTQLQLVDCELGKVTNGLGTQVYALKYLLLQLAAARTFVFGGDSLRRLARSWLPLQMMQPHVRATDVHVLLENMLWTNAFNLELEVGLLVPHIVNAIRLGDVPSLAVEENQDALTSRLADHREEALAGVAGISAAGRAQLVVHVDVLADILVEWSRTVGLASAPIDVSAPSDSHVYLSSLGRRVVVYDILNGSSVSAHFPVHRLLSAVLVSAVEFWGIAPMEELRWPVERMLVLAEAPLSLQVLTAQVQAGFWRRNGNALWATSTMYGSLFVADIGRDMDFALLQYAAAHMPPDAIVEWSMLRFGLQPFVRVESADSVEASDDHDKFCNLLGEYVRFLALLCFDRTRCGMRPEAFLEREIMLRLYVSDLSHSKIARGVYRRFAESPGFEAALSKLADFSVPDQMQQGKFRLKDEFWKAFDVFSLQASRAEISKAEERFVEFKNRSIPAAELQANRHSSPFNADLPAVVPPFAAFAGLESVVHSDLLARVLFTVLHNALYAPKFTTSDATFYALEFIWRCVLLLEQRPAPGSAAERVERALAQDAVHVDLRCAYSTVPLNCGDFLANACQRVVLPTAGAPTSTVALLCRLQQSTQYAEHRVAVGVVLRRLAALAAPVRSLIDAELPEFFASSTSSEQEEKRRKRLLAAKRQQQIMERFKRQQMAFSADERLGGDGANASAAAAESSSGEPASVQCICALCREPTDASSTRPAGLIALVQRGNAHGAVVDVTQRGVAVVRLPEEDGAASGAHKRAAGHGGAWRAGDAAGPSSPPSGGRGAAAGSAPASSSAAAAAAPGAAAGPAPRVRARAGEAARVGRHGPRDARGGHGHDDDAAVGGADDNARGGNRDRDRDRERNRDRDRNRERDRDRNHEHRDDDDDNDDDEEGSDYDEDDEESDVMGDDDDDGIADANDFMFEIANGYLPVVNGEAIDALDAFDGGDDEMEGDDEDDEFTEDDDDASGRSADSYGFRRAGRGGNGSDESWTTDDDAHDGDDDGDDGDDGGDGGALAGAVDVTIDPLFKRTGEECALFSCGHMVHFECFHRYFSTLWTASSKGEPFEGSMLIDLEQAEFLCPLCRRLGNLVVPIVAEAQRGGDVDATAVRTSAPGIPPAVVEEHRTVMTRVASQRSSVAEALSRPTDWAASLLATLCDSVRAVDVALRTSAYTPGELSAQLSFLVQMYSALLHDEALADTRPLAPTLDVLRRAPALCLPSLSWALTLDTLHAAVLALVSAPSGDAAPPGTADAVLLNVLRLAAVQCCASVLCNKTLSAEAWRVALSAPAPAPAPTAGPASPVGALLRDVQRQLGMCAAARFGRDSGADSVHIGRRPALAPGVSADECVASSLLPVVRQLLVLCVLHARRRDSYPSEDVGAAVDFSLYDSERGTSSERLARALRALGIASPDQLFAGVEFGDAPSDAVARRAACNVRCLPFDVPFPVLQLPAHYQMQLLRLFLRTECAGCSTVPAAPGICLLCGAFVCVHDDCCGTTSVGETYQHMESAHNGVCAFLLLKSSQTLLLRTQRNAYWGSLYLDSHYEEDPDLKRGRPLQLSAERVTLLSRLLSRSGLDHDSAVLQQSLRRHTKDF